MFAVIKTGGKQYKVATGDILKVEKLEGEAGTKIFLEDVLMVTDDKGSVTVGSPMIKGTSVGAEILEQTRAAKIFIFKKKRRQGYRRRAGHRQELTVLRILDIGGKTGAKKAAPVKAAKEAKAEAPVKAEAAPKKAPAAKKPAAEKAAAAKKAAAPKKDAAQKKTTAKKAAPKKAAPKTTKEK